MNYDRLFSRKTSRYRGSKYSTAKQSSEKDIFTTYSQLIENFGSKFNNLIIRREEQFKEYLLYQLAFFRFFSASPSTNGLIIKLGQMSYFDERNKFLILPSYQAGSLKGQAGATGNHPNQGNDYRCSSIESMSPIDWCTYLGYTIGLQPGPHNLKRCQNNLRALMGKYGNNIPSGSVVLN